MRWLDSVTDSMDRSLNTFQESAEDRGALSVAVHGAAESRHNPTTEPHKRNRLVMKYLDEHFGSVIKHPGQLMSYKCEFVDISFTERKCDILNTIHS